MSNSPRLVHEMGLIFAPYMNSDLQKTGTIRPIRSSPEGFPLRAGLLQKRRGYKFRSFSHLCALAEFEWFSNLFHFPADELQSCAAVHDLSPFS